MGMRLLRQSSGQNPNLPNYCFLHILLNYHLANCLYISGTQFEYLHSTLWLVQTPSETGGVFFFIPAP